MKEDMDLLVFKTPVKPQDWIRQEIGKGQRDLGSEIERSCVPNYRGPSPAATAFYF